jgi:protein TonB
MLAPPPPPTWNPGDPPLRIGGQIKEPKKIKHVAPVYPPEAQQGRIQGIVILEIRIDQDGRVSDARIVRPVALLDQAALDAVLQWEFTPTLIDGQPVPVIMTVTVNFTLQ